MSVNIAIFASGAGSNARKIIEYNIAPSPPPPLHGVERGAEQGTGPKKNVSPRERAIKVTLVASNKPGAGVLDIAREFNIPSILLEKEKFFRGNAYVDELKAAHINLIVLAGFLWKVPSALISAFPGKIINIHPALLPKYGGKGMYGHFVHEAVIAAGDEVSGITIHLVDELYDHGKAIFQAICPVLPGDTPETLAKRIHALEHANYPRVIEEFAKNSQ
jgi:phosphoribosylglycinamide formyltransferase-1